MMFKTEVNSDSCFLTQSDERGYYLTVLVGKYVAVFCLALGLSAMAGIPAQGQAIAQANDASAEDDEEFYSLHAHENILPLLDQTVTLDAEEKRLEDALREIARQTGLGLSYSTETLPIDRLISIQVQEQSAAEVIEALMANTGMQVLVTQNGEIILNPEANSRTNTELSPIQNGHFVRSNAQRVRATYPVEVQHEVQGQVFDQETSETLPGANIVVEGTTTGTSTDAEGRFVLEVPDSDGVLIVSAVGYERQEVAIEGRSEINIELIPDISGLEELVVVGYGTQRRSEVTGSVSVVDEAALDQPTFNALQALRGKVAGVNVFTNSGAPTGSNRVIIRGVGTINASSDPLYVVDGVAMENIDLINPNDIQSIEVLKDASATAIYGARGANGVILVTTKRGADQDGLVVGYQTNLSASDMRRSMDLLNAEEFMEVLEIGHENAAHYNDYDPGQEPVLTRDDPRLFDEQGNPRYDTDWQDEATRTALSHDHQLSVQSGGENMSFGAFLNYTDRQGIMRNSYMQRANLKLAFDADPLDWVSLGTNITVNRTWENNIEETGGHQMPRRTMIEMPPIFPVRFENGEWSNSHAIEDDYGFEGMANPVHVLDTQDRLRDRTQLVGNTHAAIEILPELEFRTQLGFDNVLSEDRNYSPTDLINISAPDGSASISNSEMFYWQSENYLTYENEFDLHRVNTVLGASWQERNYRTNWLGASGFTDDFFRFHDIGTATDPSDPSSYTDSWALNSYFTRASYTFDHTYMATVTARVDGSSKFGAESKYGFFPSVGLAWLASNEGFLSDVDAINHLRFRGSYGITGNSEIGVYNSLATVSSGTTLIGGSRQPSSFVQRLANPDLEWEKTSQFNIGAELNMIDQRISLEADYYHRYTHDLLLARPVPTTTGFSSVMDNIGAVSNRGVDFMATTRNVVRDGFQWETTLNFNYNQNRVEQLGAEDEDIFPGPNWVSGSQTILRVGEPLGSFYGYVREGIYGTDNDDGATPGTAKRSDNRQIIGNGLPDWTGSFINRFYVGNFDFTADFQFVYGVDVMQQYLHSVEDRTGIANGLATILHDSWTPENQDAMVQQIRHAQLSGQDSELDSRWVVDGSYLRANLISIGYSLGPEMLAQLGVQSVRLTANVENAFVLHSSDFHGHDPESSSWGGNWGQNIFFFQYPRPRTIGLGLNMQF